MKYIHTSYVALLLLCFLLPSCSRETPKYNVVVLFTDDQRFNTIQALGNSEIFTPHLDKLVKMGVSFTHAHVMGSYHGAVCAPSRAMLLSGKPYMSIPRGFIDQGAAQANQQFDFTIFPEYLRNMGYRSFFTGKWHNNTSKIKEGFDDGENIFVGGMHWPRDGGHRSPQLWDFDTSAVYDQSDKWQADKFSSEMFSDAAVDFVNEQDEDHPFCLYIAYSSPHDPREAPDEFAKMYDPESIVLPQNYLEAHPFDNGHLRTRDENLAPFPRTEEIVKQEIAGYYAMISEVDAQIGRVISTLEDKHLLDQTIIVFAGDNGLAVGQHGLMGKQSVYDHSVRVPLIIAAPQIDGNKRTEALCYLHDVYPTICDLLNIDIPESVEGESLFSILKNPNEIHREQLFLSHAKQMRAVRTKDHWKLINYFVKGESRQQLFNLNKDEFEMNNLADKDEFSDKKKELESLLVNDLIEKNDFLFAHIKLEQEHFSKPVTVSMSSSFPNISIRYTLDGSTPTASSALYEAPFNLTQSTPIRATQFLNEQPFGDVYTAEAKISPAIKRIHTHPQADAKYPGKGSLTLINGANGDSDIHSGNYLGYEAEDLIAIIELKESQSINKVGVRFLNSPGSWIFSPKNIRIWSSEDGENYEPMASYQFQNRSEYKVKGVELYEKSTQGESAKFIKFEIENQGTCPDWHLGKGQKAWMFIDELILE